MIVRRGEAQPETWFREGCWITEWSNLPEDPAASIARARVPAGGTTRWHALDGITERYVILAGTGRVEIGQAEPVDVAPGDVIVIAPFEPQRITSTGEVDLIFLAICTPRFRPEAYREVPPPAAAG
ncbi:MAG: cupin domain-containing protein [Pseudomonadota bacterium]